VIMRTGKLSNDMYEIKDNPVKISSN